jgi:GNAT superfamily N-acetyltransferase
LSLSIEAATVADVPLILGFIRELADYERLSDQVSASEAALQATLFGERPAAEVLIARHDGVAAGFALFFQNYSTFLAKPGIYLEDLYVKPEQRGHGIGRALLTHIARLAVARDCGRFEWSVLDWNAPAIGFYRSLGALPQDEWTIMRLTGDALKTLASAN